MSIQVAGFDSSKIPPVFLHYFPDTNRGVAPNLRAGVDGVDRIVREAQRLAA